MTKIKHIHCFGTSHTAGGGFEFDSTNLERSNIIKKLYSNADTPLTQYNFSYPGQLQKFIGNDIKVNNHAKQGYGNDRMYRILHDITNEPGFDSSENLLLLEFTGLGRCEKFFNKIQDYITINWQHSLDNDGNLTDKGAHLLGVANSYHYDSQNFLDIIKDLDSISFFEKYVENFINLKDESSSVLKYIEFFISYLDKLNLKYYYVSPPIVSNETIFNTKKNKIVFGDGVYFKKNTNMLEFAYKNNLIINIETNNRYTDDHNSFKSNKLCAHIIYNKLVLDGFIDKELSPIDWKSYKEKSYINNII
jgi:hypothetical protein